MRKLCYTAPFVDGLRNLCKAEQERVLSSLEKIREKPELGNPLRAPLSGFFAERVGRLRIIYEYDEENVYLHLCRERKAGY